MISPTMRSGTPTQRKGKKTIPTMVRTAPTMSNNAPEVSWSVKSVPPRSEKGRTHSPSKNVLRFVPFVPASAGVWSGGARRGVPPCGLTWYKYSRPYQARSGLRRREYLARCLSRCRAPVPGCGALIADRVLVVPARVVHRVFLGRIVGVSGRADSWHARAFLVRGRVRSPDLRIRRILDLSPRAPRLAHPRWTPSRMGRTVSMMALVGSKIAPKSGAHGGHARTFKTMTPHVARGYYGGAVVLFRSGADASSEEQGIVDRGCRHRRGSRRPSGGGTRWIVHARSETSASNWNAVVDHGCAQPVRAGRYARRLSCRPPD